MSRIRCFLIEPTGRVRVQARRYASGACSHHGDYHDVRTTIGEEPVTRNEKGYVTNGNKRDEPPEDDPCWPTSCPCGYQFQQEDIRQRFVEELYRNVTTGEETTIRDAEPGAMWYAWWYDEWCTPQGEHALVVKTPGGDWIVDSQANNCGLPEDSKQEKHHCWVRTGTPPDVTVGKDGVSCSAGAGSIQCGSYHGFLRGGFLED